MYIPNVYAKMYKKYSCIDRLKVDERLQSTLANRFLAVLSVVRLVCPIPGLLSEFPNLALLA